MRTPARSIGLVATLAVLATVSGCTPADLPMTALRLVNGKPTLLVLACKDFHARRVSAYTESAPSETWTIDKSTDPAPEQITLLTTPYGWTSSEHTLTELTPGTEYGVSAHGYRLGAFPIQFTIEELNELTPGQVLVHDSGSRRHAVAESTFREDARDACD